MKASELRLGNLFYLWDDGIMGNKVHVVYEINEYELNGFKSKLREAEPIPITEEWLLKLGFEKIVNTRVFGENMWSLRGILTIEFSTQFGFKYDAKSSFKKYLHQLQNLIFALTGEELTINQPA